MSFLHFGDLLKSKRHEWIGGSFSHAHDFVVNQPQMNDTRINTQNVYNQASVEQLSPIQMTAPCTSRNFVGQEKYLEKLREHFGRDDNNERKMFLLYGIGGIGKTQICLKFNDEMNDVFSNVLWIDTTTEDTVIESLKNVYKSIAPPGTPASSFSAAATLKSISTLENRWLMIYDNADGSPEVVEKFLPPGNQGSILITSRNPALRRITTHESSLEITEMDLSSAIKLILKASGSDMSSETDRETAKMIAQQLHCHPLALDMAGAYITQTQCHINEFVGIYNQSRSIVLDNEKFQGASKYSKSVYRTWEISFKTISEMSKRKDNKIEAATAKYAMVLINLCAFFHFENISQSIFQRAADKYYSDQNGKTKFPNFKNNKILINDQQLFNQSVELLLSYSLLKKSLKANSYSMHPLIHLYCQDRLSLPEKTCWIADSRAVIAISVGNNDGSINEYRYQNMILPHLLKNFDCEKQIGDIPYRKGLISTAADIFELNKKYDIEEECRLKVVKADLDDILGNKNNIAVNWDKLQKMAQKKHYQMYLKISERFINTIAGIMKLVQCLNSQGKVAEAEKFCVQAMDLCNIIKGQDHPKTYLCMHTLAMTYFHQNRLDDAEKLMIRELEIYGENIPTLANLAILYNKQGNYTNAEKFAKKLIHLSVEMSGKDDFATQKYMSILTRIYQIYGKWTEAEELCIELLHLREKNLGKENINTIDCMEDMIRIYQEQSKYCDAEKLAIEVMNLRQKLLGEEHPDTLYIMSQLACIFTKQEKFSDFKDLVIKIMNIKESSCNTVSEGGEVYDESISQMHNFAMTYFVQNRLDEAEKLMTQELELYQKIHGKDSAKTISTLANLAILYNKQGNYTNAEKFGNQLIHLSETTSGKDDVATQKYMLILTRIYMINSKWTEAEELCTELLHLRDKTLGKDNIDTIKCMEDMTRILREQNKYSDAEKLGIEVMNLRQKLFGEEHPDTLSSMTDLANAYKKQGKLSDAEQLEMRVKDLTERIAEKE